MITIVIADDEKLIRAGIKKIITDSLGVPVSVLEAKNGAEALELCTTELPDLIITDIRMPCMDGVELMHRLAQCEQRPSLIVLSGFDDFSYAKEAIAGGAVSYILKPVDKKELISAVNTAIAVSRKEEKARTEQMLKKIADEGRFDSSCVPGSFRFDNGLCCTAVTGARCLAVVSRILQPVRFYVLEQKKDFVMLVVPCEAVYLLETDLSAASFSAGISASSGNLSALRTLRMQAFAALLQSFFADSAGRRSPGVFRFTESSAVSDFSAIDSAYEKCISRLDIASVAEIQRDMELLFDFAKISDPRRAAVLYYLYNKVMNNLFKRFPGCSGSDMYLHLKSIMIENIWQFASVNEWKTCICDYTVYLAALLQQNTAEYPFITDALEYVKTHFAKNINMAMVANHVSVNYTWFSEKFKEHVGINFNEYLKRIRITEAQRLLSKGCYKVYEVAQKSGFSDVKYFMKTFKEATGMSPGEYRKVKESQTHFAG
ncbi:response regulator transcription factor [Treponema brennaborense]|uniref:Two component transcriptional regulator, AraC family n=1 Tax=Treponema brennaborense (strain DSM 12168 / CIP 105900 / DD5/3) TaxID=906968 RepID=F4LND0_TREBD|nr:response regulator [Treponema brennaborense]AEE17888.1 two component transcriptional regulator, AraC family [Treponema brennaborense DSM 12168]